MAYGINSKDYFSTLLYSGNSTARSLTGVGFAPSFVWIKERTADSDHMLFDQPRGVQKYISANQTTQQQTSAGMLTAFGSDGFSLGSGNDTNDNGQTYVAWNWIGNGQGSSNTDGGINTTYTSVNTASGVSISTYTGTGSASTIGHGLGVTPNVMLAKRLDSSGQWDMYHSGLSNPKSGSIVLNSSDDFASDSSIWNNTDPTSSLVNIGTSSTTNTSSGTYVMYCFVAKQSFSAFGSYNGNGNDGDGTFVYTSFKPSLVMIKCSDTDGEHWHIHDTKRKPGNNDSGKYLLANTAGTESTSTSYAVEIVSNGFKARTSNNSTNGTSGGSGRHYLYIAFADEPLVSTNGVPATAR